MAFFGWSLILAGAWFIDCAVQNRPPLRSLKGVLADNPATWSSGVKTYDGQLADAVTSPVSASPAGTAPSGGGGTRKPPAAPSATQGKRIGGNPPAPIIAP